MSICIVDTSVLCEILDVGHRTRSHERFLKEYGKKVSNQETLVAPVATIVETGNHIAHIGDGTLRRRAAKRLVDILTEKKAGSGRVIVAAEEWSRWESWLLSFPDHATRAIGIGDLSIIQVFERFRAICYGRRVYIWTKDEHLRGRDTVR